MVLLSTPNHAVWVWLTKVNTRSRSGVGDQSRHVVGDETHPFFALPDGVLSQPGGG